MTICCLLSGDLNFNILSELLSDIVDYDYQSHAINTVGLHLMLIKYRLLTLVFHSWTARNIALIFK